MSLEDLLKELGVEQESNEKEIDFSKVNLEEIPETHRPIFEKAKSIIDEQSTALAETNLKLEAMTQAFEKIPKPKEEEKKKEEFMGLKEDDPYVPVFKNIVNMIQGIGKETPESIDEKFKEDLSALFENDKKGVIEHRKEMDVLVRQHPTLKKDVQKLYELAKLSKQKGGENKNKQKSSEGGGGITNISVRTPTQSKSIMDAFENAEKQLRRVS